MKFEGGLRFLLAAALVLRCSREAPRPNVLLITLDTFRADRVGPLSPNLLQLAQSGTQYTQADTAVPLTLPAHATILSGLLPLQHGLRNNGAGSMTRETVAQTFVSRGYRTAAFVSAFVLDHRFGLNRGFETYDDAVDRTAADVLEAERQGGQTVEHALGWLRRNDARPFFAWVHLYDPHAPYAPPAPFPQTYDGEIAYVDQQIGRLLAGVDRSKTLIVVVGDHGESLGEHDEATHGLLLYESTLHVPLIVAGPGIDARRDEVPISTAEVAAMLRGDGQVKARADVIYAETQYPAMFGWAPMASLRRGSNKLIAGVRQELVALPDERSTDDRRLLHELAAKLTSLQSTAPATSAPAADAETRAKLASLGYVSGGAAVPRNKDPRDMAGLFSRFEAANRAHDVLALESLTREDASNPVFITALARAYRDRGDLSLSLPLYREAAGLSPSDADAWYNLAVCLQEMGRGGEALDAAKEALKFDPNRSDAHVIAGIAEIEAGDAVSAERSFRKAVELDPRNARALTNLGNVLRATERLSDARAAYELSLAVGPNDPDALNGLGVVAVQEGKPQEALGLFDAALRVFPNFYEASLNRAIAIDATGDRAAAAAAVRDLLKRLPAGSRYDPQRDAARKLLAVTSR